jgi:hypothetical protein
LELCLSDNVANWLEEFYELNPDAIAEEVEVKKKKSTLTLDMELPAMDFGNKNFYRDLSEEHKKEIGLWVLMRFMSSSQNMPEHHLMMVNDLVNHNFSHLSKHPELQWKLLALCGTGRKQYHPWIAPPKGLKKNKLEEAILKFYPLLRDDEIDLMLSINTTEDFEQFFRDNGYDDKTIKELLKDNVKK